MYPVSYYMILASIIAGFSRNFVLGHIERCFMEREEYNPCGCPRTCDNHMEPIVCTDDCIGGCFCIEGHVRNGFGSCILPQHCVCTGANEEYSDCGTSCPKTCENRKDTSASCTENCVSGCFCKEGFVKDSNGICVSPDQCQQNNCTGVNEVYSSCGTACPITCDNLIDRGVCTGSCVSGCFCKEGYVRNSQGICVWPYECETNVCKENEEFTQCGTSCQKNCSNFYKAVACILMCVPGCFCKEGFVRNENGDCIPTSECEEPKCGDKEIFNLCGTTCPKTCRNKDTSEGCNTGCNPGCFCIDGYVRNEEDNTCIRPKKCPKPKCGHKEVFDPCGTMCPKTCSNKDKTEECPAGCNAGCFCKKGYVRNEEDKTCIRPKKCPKPKCGLHEVYKRCGTMCPKTCGKKDNTAECTTDCAAGCFCKKKYVRNEKNNECVLPENCPTDQCKENEEYQICGITTCQKTCDNYEFNISCDDDVCSEGCFCKKGYVRDANNNCIEPWKCPKKNCGENEQFYDCIPKCQNTCEVWGRSFDCGESCVSGCFCKQGLLLRNDTMCVPYEQCNPGEVPPPREFPPPIGCRPCPPGHMCPDVICLEE